MTSASESATPSPSNFLQLCDLVKTFGTHKAVDHVNLSIGKGEIFALLGSSGCGKTTLLRMLAGFETSTSGQIILNGADLSGLPPYERPLNMMFQSYALFPHLTVWDNIAFGLRRMGLPKDQVQTQVEAMLNLVQLSAFGKRKPHQLSGGQQQRVALARSLAQKPQLLLLDEPLGALDKKLREQTQRELVKILHDVGVTCVMVTHDQEEAMAMASRIGIMSEGRLLQVGTPSEIYESPANRFVAEFIGNVNLLEGTLDATASHHARVRCADGAVQVGHSVSASVGTAVTVALRPEKLRLSRDATDATANQLRGTLQDIAYFGSYTVYRLATASGKVLSISASNAERQSLDPLHVGDTAWASWSESAPVVLTS
jgi:putrescine transport system ATP-binding protein